MADLARRLVKSVRGLRTVYACPFCRHSTIAPSGRGMGRGHGLRTGGALHSQMAAHIRAEHPDRLAKAAELVAAPRVYSTQSAAHYHARALVEATGSRAWGVEPSKDRSAFTVSEPYFHKERTGL